MTLLLPPDTLIVIPAFNEELSLPHTLTEVLEVAHPKCVLVVDDGSCDHTYEVARKHGVHILRLPFNLGVGAAMRLGFRFAVREGYSRVVQVDADGQHNPRDLPRLLAPSSHPENAAEVVVGARFAGAGSFKVTLARRFAMSMLANFVSIMAGQRLTDVTSGFRVTSGRALTLFAENFPEEYLGDTIESLVMAARCGLRITQVPVEMRLRRAGEPSQSPLRSIIYIARILMVMGVSTLRQRPALKQAGDATP